MAYIFLIDVSWYWLTFGETVYYAHTTDIDNYFPAMGEQKEDWNKGHITDRIVCVEENMKYGR